VNQTKSIIKSIISFFKSPNNNTEVVSPKNFTESLFDVIRLIGIEVTISFILSIALTILLSLSKYDSSQHEITQFIKDNSWYSIIFFASIYAPITEEITFRLGLKYSPVRVGLSISFIIFFVLQVLDSYQVINLSNSLYSIKITNSFAQIVFMFSITILSGLLISLIFRVAKINEASKNTFKKIFPFLLFSSSIVFGIAHSTNYANLQSIWFLIPFLGIPQIVIGLFLGYIRTRYGFKWSVFTHSTHNTLAIVPTILLTFTSSNFQDAIYNTNKVSEQTLTSLLTTTDYLLILAVLLYFGLMLLAILVIWIQVLIELKKDKKWQD
jgi:hypothetical protein